MTATYASLASVQGAPYAAAGNPPARRPLLLQCAVVASLLGVWTWISGCSAPLQDPSPSVTVVFSDDGTFSIAGDDIALSELTPVLLLPDGDEFSPRATAGAWTNDGSHSRYAFSADDVSFTVDVEVEADRVRVRMFAQGDIDIRGFSLRGRASEGAAGVYQEGYSSWSPAHYVALAEGAIDEDILTGVDGAHLFADPRLSWWVGAIHYDNETALVGAVTAERFKSRMLTYRDPAGATRWHMVSGSPNEQISAENGVGSETLVLTVTSQPTAAFTLYGDEVQATHPVLPAPFVPVGWNSWNTFFTDIEPADLREMMAQLPRILPELPINTIQLDDGWQRAWGDWTENEKFAEGLDVLADDMRAAGYIPGIWWAPFLVDVDAAVTQNQPEWLLRNASGEPVFYGSATLGYRYYILDVTHPEVERFILDTLQELLDDGYRYLKLDFLFGAASEGVRYDKGATGISAYRHIVSRMSALATSYDAYLLACGAPLLPSAGAFHAMRTGDDIAFADLSYSFAMNKNAFRNLAHRFYVNAFLTNDPDTILLRDLSLEAQRLNLVGALMSGRIVNLGDDLRSLPDESVSLLGQLSTVPGILKRLQDPAGSVSSFLPLDLFAQPNAAIDNKFAHILAPDDYRVPAQWLLSIDAETHLLALFNWWSEGETQSVTLPMDDPDGYTGRELWTDAIVPVTDGRLQVAVPAEGVRWIVLRRDSPATP